MRLDDEATVAPPPPPDDTTPSSRGLSLATEESPPPREVGTDGTAHTMVKEENGSAPGDNVDELLGEDEDDLSARRSSEALVALQGLASHAGSSAGTTLGGVPKVSQAAFVHKLYQMVQTPSLLSLIAWSDTGTTFSVFNPQEFSRTVLPQYFKHSNFQSFVRQLNMYGFHKVNDMLGGMSHSTEGVIAWEFQHPSFQRDRSELLANIKRKSSKTNSSTPSDSPVTRKSALSSSSSGGSGRPTSSRERRLSESVKLEPESMPQEPLPPTFAPSYRASGVPMPDFAYAARDPGPPRMSGSREGGRPTGERDSPIRRSPPPPPPPPPQAPSYPHPNPHISPRASHYSPLPASAYPGPFVTRPPTNDDVARQIAGLDNQVRSLSEALYYSQEDARTTSVVSQSIIRLLLGIVGDMNLDAERKAEVEKAHIALSKLADSPAPSQPSIFNYAPSSSWQPPPPNSAVTRSPRPSTSSSAQFFYSRPPPAPAESFTRGGGGGGPPNVSRRPSRDDSSPFPSYPPLVPLSSSNNNSVSESGFSRDGGPQSERSPSFGNLLASRPGTSSSFQYSPRLSWHSNGSGSTRPSSAGLSHTRGSGDTLPPLSALFGAPPSSAEGLRRPATGEGGEGGEDAEEQARKKIRR